MVSDSYVTVTATLKARSQKAILLSHDENLGGAWIARSCIHGADERKLDDYAIGDEVELRLFEWLAEKEGFV